METAISRSGSVLIRLAVALSLAGPAVARPAAKPPAAPVRVRLQTSIGPIVIALETKRAPITTRNFLRYVDERRFDNTSFYRAARNRHAPKFGLVQGGIDRNARLTFGVIAHEPTSLTGIKHVNGTVSMARNAPGTAMGDFFITVGPASYLDARPGYVGYAAFGKVVSGMPLISKILAARTYPGGWPETKGQIMVEPVKILTARRVP
ncbi:MAG: cyclophilin type peptidyl-prolyl cis-trans isomerase [Sphingomonas bacterium]|nr:cyclophilin type peptidyl-prolyl cis-trans isomerase [Sphingomonas bacterium]MDB5717150.1 cyclophilin type peptidyl-prolyl cis-trans isomerase [Sphingomonas bacterium]